MIEIMMYVEINQYIEILSITAFFQIKSGAKVRRFNSMSIVIKFYDALQILRKPPHLTLALFH